MLFESCYATGERTVQGLEAILSSFPSLPGVAAVRRPQARHGFETLATTLRARGYDTLFLYGGQGIFDDMRGFFVGNGFDVFLEERDFDERRLPRRLGRLGRGRLPARPRRSSSDAPRPAARCSP